MLLSALLELMEHKLYSSISIKELAECAGLDRKKLLSKFHFERGGVVSAAPGDVPGIYKRTEEIAAAYFVCGTKPYFQICVQHRHFFMLLKKNNFGDFGMLQSAGWRAVQRKVQKKWCG